MQITTTRLGLLTAAIAGMILVACDARGPEEGDATRSAESGSAAEALAEALTDPDGYARARKLAVLLPSLGPEAVPDVKEALEKFQLNLDPVGFDLMLRYWATHDPAGATAWTFKKSSPIYRNSGTRTVIEIWAEQDPAAAVVATESALRESDQEVARFAEIALVQGWFRNDRVGLEQYIRGLGSGVKRQRALFTYLLALAAEDGSDAAIAFAEAMPDDEGRFKQDTYRQLMSALAFADTPKAMEFCSRHCDGVYGRGLRNALIRTQLRRKDFGGDVVAWVGRVPEIGDEQTKNKLHSLWVAYSTWAYREQEAAIQWMAEKLAEPEPEYWTAYLYAEYARQIAKRSPEEAIQWAERVEDEVDRERTLVRIAHYWLTQDPAAADAWLEQASLSESARALARDSNMPIHLPIPAEH